MVGKVEFPNVPSAFSDTTATISVKVSKWITIWMTNDNVYLCDESKLLQGDVNLDAKIHAIVAYIAGMQLQE